MTTLKQKQAADASAWLAIKPTGGTAVKPYAERMRFHEMDGIGERKAIPKEPKYFDAIPASLKTKAEQDAWYAEQEKADHFALSQVGRYQSDAVKAGGSVQRYNARQMFESSRKNLQEAAGRRHTPNGWGGYQRIYFNLKAYQQALVKLGGPELEIPPMLRRDSEEKA